MSQLQRTCPHCEVPLVEFESNLEDDKEPKPGNLCICEVCASILAFKEDLNLRLVTGEDLKQLLMENPHHYRQLKNAQMAVYKESKKKK